MKRKALLIPHNMYRSFTLLSNEECGRLFMAVLDYDINGTVTEFDDLALEILFMQLKNVLDYNRVHYDEVCQKRSEVAKKRWEKLKESDIYEE